jgi:hypothetical protein
MAWASGLLARRPVAREEGQPVRRSQRASPLHDPIVYEYAYLMYAPTLTLYKIGYTRSPWSRLSGIRNCEKYGSSDAKLVHTIFTNNGPQLERDLHVRFQGQRVMGEWFRLDRESVLEIFRVSAVYYKGQPSGQTRGEYERARVGGWNAIPLPRAGRATPPPPPRHPRHLADDFDPPELPPLPGNK